MKNQFVGLTRTCKLLVAIACAIFLASCSEERFNPELTQLFTIQSKINGARYIIKVALPIDYDASSKKYSTIYVLDGEENFDFISNKCHEISSREGVQNALVVSICYGNDRILDYTPTQVSASTGGGGKFLLFIKDELIPYLEAEFNVGTARQDRVIIGHSYGGLFGTFAFATDNQIFGNYLLLSPSLWYDNEVILIEEQQNRTVNKAAHNLVFLGIGELENSGRMQVPLESFYQSLYNNYDDLVLSKNREKRLDHVGSKNPNIIKALEFYFTNR